MLEKVGADSRMDFDKYEEHINRDAGLIHISSLPVPHK